MYSNTSTVLLYKRLLFVLLASGFIGWLFDIFWPAIAISSIALLIWHYHHLVQLAHWLWQSKSINPPHASGTWGRIYDGLFHVLNKQRKKQKQLRHRIRQFRDGAEALPDAAVVLSDDFIIEWSNKKAQNLLGIVCPGDVGQRIDNLIRNPEFTRVLYQQAFEAPFHIDSPLKEDTTLELRIMTYGVDQYLLVARDVSKLNRLETMRRDFVANVSHELKTPLTVMRGYIEMIQAPGNNFDEHWLTVFATIEGQVTRMDRLVEQLLILSKVENNATYDETYRVNLSDLVTNIVKECHWLNQDKQHKITSDIAPDIYISGIETELKSACTNLISNAIAYTPAQGDIQVSLEQVKQSMGMGVKFTVKDNGSGIKPEHVNRITERFYRIDKSRSRNTGGSGLGLSIVKHVLQHHNAELVINSQWGVGSEFSIIFSSTSVIQ
ncbi:phosphate regulon sensor histidine kinase PhoR [Thalassotalea sp. LPB0316]|uniref:phosphate regulon sensor histidine kinase PhoR n=1 Tax=Thalassotalea sp. LPB0316 TaxID=2769490 RepID=UPI0018677061|nr:phosphate regulon sensor histidine kinase PhoR [Thalassotalea sp. LPB0316]QOL27013.1 phosphate regulon sensor histidine kinase PhoR [Thalassotalea sp. LPB0316]